MIGRLHQSVKRGEPLADGIEREPQAFDKLFLSMIRVAEARGGAPETLKLLGRHYEARQSLMRQARSAMIYPIVVLVVASCVVALLTIWLLPLFAGLLAESTRGQTVDLPLPSRVLLAVSSFVQRMGWLVIPIVMIGTPIVLLQTYKTDSGKRFMDRLALWIPVFGPLLRKLDVHDSLCSVPSRRFSTPESI